MSSPNGERVQRALQGALVNAILGNERIARESGLLVIPKTAAASISSW
jgi:hypothetical protein